MARIPIVDESDIETGFKNRSEIQLSDIYRVSALWITNSKGEVLMARRALTKTHDPGRWGPAVAGTVEEGETYETNIVKETLEELGVQVSIDDLERGPKALSQGTHKHWGQWFLYKTDWPIEKFTIPADEVAEIKWFTPAELLREFDKDPKQFVKSCKQFLPLFVDGISPTDA